jgi:hypothetical protein
MGIVFLICFVTGLFKFTLLMRMLGLTGVVMPLALMSDIHDWSGVILGIVIAVHLILNSRWILSMTKKMLEAPKVYNNENTSQFDGKKA